MAPNSNNTLKSYVEAFSILAKSGIDYTPVITESDLIEVDLHPANVSDEDKLRLEALDWFVDEEMSTFYHFTN